MDDERTCTRTHTHTHTRALANGSCAHDDDDDDDDEEEDDDDNDSDDDDDDVYDARMFSVRKRGSTNTNSYTVIREWCVGHPYAECKAVGYISCFD